MLIYFNFDNVWVDAGMGLMALIGIILMLLAVLSLHPLRRQLRRDNVITSPELPAVQPLQGVDVATPGSDTIFLSLVYGQLAEEKQPNTFTPPLPEDVAQLEDCEDAPGVPLWQMQIENLLDGLDWPPQEELAS